MTILPLILFGIFVYKINQVNQKTEDYLNKNKVTDTCYSADESKNPCKIYMQWQVELIMKQIEQVKRIKS